MIVRNRSIFTAKVRKHKICETAIKNQS